MVECLLPDFPEKLARALRAVGSAQRLAALLDAIDDAVATHGHAGAVPWINAGIAAAGLPVQGYDDALAYLRAHGYCILPRRAGGVVSSLQFTDPEAFARAQALAPGDVPG